MKNLLAVLALWLATIGVTHAAVPFPTGCIQPITVGAAVNGQLATTDCFVSGSGTSRFYLDVYSFTATAGTQIATRRLVRQLRDAGIELPSTAGH